MMKKPAFLLLSCLAGILLLTGCAKSNAAVKAQLGKEFKLSIGQQAEIATEKMTVAFIDITEDSRCASDVVCIQAGQVTAIVSLNINGEQSTVELTARMPITTQQIGDYTFSFKVTPYPVSTHRIQKTEYQLHMTVTNYSCCGD